MTSLHNFIDIYKRRRILNLLTQSEPDVIEAYGRKRIIPAFQRAAQRLPAYRKLLADYDISADDIIALDEFKRKVPVITKADLFASASMEDLVVDGRLNTLANVTVSSGFTGENSCGIGSFADRRQTAFMIDTTLEYLFNISRKKTFLLNCLPMGVKIPSALPMAETGVRSDLALSILQKLRTGFEQFLIVGDPYFLKKLIEDGCAAGLDWPGINVSLILGADWFSDSYRNYLAELLGIDFDRPDRGYIGANFGITELALSIGHETIETIRLRQALQKDSNLRKQILGNLPGEASPEILVYYPNRFFLENAPDSHELVFSTLDPAALTPLIRYNTKDTGVLLPHNTVRAALTRTPGAERLLLPELKLPLLALQGRANQHLNLAGKTVRPEDIKEGLYSDPEVAGLTTGYFRMSAQQDIGQIEIQLKKNIPLTADLRQKFRKALLKLAAADLEIVIYHYQDFPYGMELNYERKFICV